jgi:hypothetical protein
MEDEALQLDEPLCLTALYTVLFGRLLLWHVGRFHQAGQILGEFL